MGEYAKYKGERVKIGTCENMYYLRYDQRHDVTPLSGNVNPAGPERFALRFRFPWPSEDGIEPGGNFEPFERSVCVPGLAAPADVEHHSVQFVAQAGYNCCLPCPESGKEAFTAGVCEPGASNGLHPVKIHRNGYKGAVLLAYQKPVEGIGLVPVLMCGGCGSMWREEERERIEEIAMLFRSEGDRRERDGERNGTGKADRRWYDQVADRVLAGINNPEGFPSVDDDTQPRLPGDVGNVRDQEHAQPPVADVPEGFSLRPPAETEPTQTNLLRFTVAR